MSELKIFELARVKMETKRRELAGVLASTDANMGEIAGAFNSIQNAIDAIDRAIADEKRLVDPSAAVGFGKARG